MTHEQLIEEAVKEFDKVFPCIQEGCDNYGTIPEQDGDGDWQPAQCEFCYKIRFPVKEYFEKALNTIASKSAEVERKNAVNDCWYAILDLPHNSETGYTAELDLDDIYEKFKQLKSKGQNE